MCSGGIFIIIRRRRAAGHGDKFSHRLCEGAHRWRGNAARGNAVGRFSGYLSYANQSGIGQGPITGGLFLGDDAANALTDASKFAVSQDQRNTTRARVRFQAERRVWLAMGAQYGSGLRRRLAARTSTTC